MAKKRKKQETHKGRRDLTPAQMRKYADALDALSRRIHRVADDCEGFGIKTLPIIPQGLETLITDKLDEKVTKEFETRRDAAVAELARKTKKIIE